MAQASTWRDRRVLAWVAVFMGTILVACSGDHDHTNTPGLNSSGEANYQATLEYLTEHYPTRDQMLQVHACVTARTGYAYPELPADFGPVYLTMTPPPDAEDLGEPDEAGAAYVDCIFDLGLEDRFFPPWEHEALRRAMSSQ